MREKDIKRLVVKQLKSEFPNWRRLKRKEKKKLASQVLEEMKSGYDFGKELQVSLSELTSTDTSLAGVIRLADMGAFIEDATGRLLSFARSHSRQYIRDEELRAIDEMLDDRVINRLLATESYTPSMRGLFPYHYLRAELLKSLRYSEFSYRKYCKEVINKLENKTERAFIHLPLHKKTKIDHSQMSQFRRDLSVNQLVNLLVYVIHILINGGKLAHPFSIVGIDSSEIAACCNPAPLATVSIGQKKVRIYSELDADCGKRRKKRDKSEYFVGYRIHTLVAIDPKSGENFPLFSLVAPGNHHDKLFVPQLLSFAQAMGLEIKVLTADEAYADALQNEAIYRNYGVRVITPPHHQVELPPNVDPQSYAVYMDSRCEIPMDYMGRTEAGHEFKCSDDNHECVRNAICSKYREISVDAGIFGQIPDQVEGLDEVRDLRKHMERAYNLIKHRDGLEPLRVRSQHGLMAVATFSQMCTLLLEIIGSRKSKPKEIEIEKLAFAS